MKFSATFLQNAQLGFFSRRNDAHRNRHTNAQWISHRKNDASDFHKITVGCRKRRERFRCIDLQNRDAGGAIKPDYLGLVFFLVGQFYRYLFDWFSRAGIGMT